LRHGGRSARRRGRGARRAMTGTGGAWRQETLTQSPTSCQSSRDIGLECEGTRTALTCRGDPPACRNEAPDAAASGPPLEFPVISTLIGERERPTGGPPCALQPRQLGTTVAAALRGLFSGSRKS
jgi:hypothetical protein